MTPRTSSRRVRALVAAGAVTSALGLGACSALGDPSAAALVDGEVVVSQAEVATVAREFPVELSGGELPPASQILTFLALDEPVRDLARETGTDVVSQTQALDFLAAADEEAGRDRVAYSEPTLQLFATNLTLGQIGQDEENVPLIQEMVSQVGEELEVNPRYGEVSEDGVLLIQPVEHPWLVSSDA